ncbi:MAG: hypothetical protein FGM14_04845 [Flavobacteriales bacterium]|nr:hypothetical protein [Flavobacteriales bacterium]
MVDRIIDVMMVTLGILVAFVLYKLMLKRMSRGGVDQTSYCTLYSLDKNPASGEVEFYFIAPSEMKVAFCIWKQEEKLVEIRNEVFTKGGHIVRFVTNSIPDGEYFFGIQTTEQKTIKRFRIKNS